MIHGAERGEWAVARDGGARERRPDDPGRQPHFDHASLRRRRYNGAPSAVRPFEPRSKLARLRDVTGAQYDGRASIDRGANQRC